MPRSKLPYTQEFRKEAVDLYVSSGRPLKRVAEELGNWKKDLLGGSGGQSRAVGEALAGADPEQMAEEIRRLHREVEYLKRQREILKKAASILAEDPQLGMR